MVYIQLANTISGNILLAPLLAPGTFKRDRKQLQHTSAADNVPNAQKQITQTAQWVFRSNRPTRVINYTIQAITLSPTVKAAPNTECLCGTAQLI